MKLYIHPNIYPLTINILHLQYLYAFTIHTLEELIHEHLKEYKKKGVDFRATLKVLELIWVSVGTCGLVIDEHIGLESDGSNHAKSVSHHFYHIENDPQLRAILYMVPSVKLASHGHFIAYDEALELFGVEFVKQNVTRIPTDKEKLKLKHN
ncbi:hypothetical protein RhiirC2_793741 [Rhizophagus irregularis]|uniref:Uncharacterized protein n=1 Tax=Rhizophagus irregularis TaxID=588596 RepID=A0A2N1MEU0_9GLOM|nr:hypothetical protein RhiirC2_793741 [Rhizophagus irregularis]